MPSMGTRFINTKESQADEKYQQMIIESSASDIIYTAAVSGVNANFLKPSLESMGITEEMWGDKAKMETIVTISAELAGSTADLGAALISSPSGR